MDHPHKGERHFDGITVLNIDGVPDDMGHAITYEHIADIDDLPRLPLTIEFEKYTGSTGVFIPKSTADKKIVGDIIISAINMGPHAHALYEKGPLWPAIGGVLEKDGKLTLKEISLCTRPNADKRIQPLPAGVEKKWLL